MHLGCPVIASCKGALPEVCGDSVLYIDPHSPETIVSAIEKVLQSPPLRDALKIKGEEQSHKYEWKRCADAHLRVIEQLVQQ